MCHVSPPAHSACACARTHTHTPNEWSSSCWQHNGIWVGALQKDLRARWTAQRPSCSRLSLPLRSWPIAHRRELLFLVCYLWFYVFSMNRPSHLLDPQSFIFARLYGCFYVWQHYWRDLWRDRAFCWRVIYFMFNWKHKSHFKSLALKFWHFGQISWEFQLNKKGLTGKQSLYYNKQGLSLQRSVC